MTRNNHAVGKVLVEGWRENATQIAEAIDEASERPNVERWEAFERVRAMVPSESVRVTDWENGVRSRVTRGLPVKALLIVGLDRQTVDLLRSQLAQLMQGVLVEVLDVGLDSQLDLIVPHVSAALLSMAEQGLIDGLIALPPSSTWSSTRVGSRARGAPVLRVRGDYEWGLPNLRGAEKLLVAEEKAMVTTVCSMMTRVLKACGSAVQHQAGCNRSLLS